MREAEIIELILARDERGMDALLHQYGPLMRYVIAPILPNEQDREECVSDAAMRLWDKIGLYKAQEGSCTAYLTAVCRNTALNRARSAKKDAQTGPLPDAAVSPEKTPEERLLKRERQERLMRALSLLSPSEREMFYRKYYYCQPARQIAAELGMTERAVEGRLYRLKKRLKSELGGEDDA